MAISWQVLHGDKAQPRHNLHVLDASIVSNLYKLERRIHADELLEPDTKTRRREQQQKLVQQRNHEPMLFNHVLEMCCGNGNILVIPQSILREVYGKAHYTRKFRNPLVDSKDGNWEWAYNSMADIDRLQDATKTSWDDRGVLLSRIMQRAFDDGGMDVCNSPQEFAEKYATYHPGMRMVVVRDSAVTGDDSIRDIFSALNGRDFGQISIMSSDVGLQRSLMPLQESFLSIDTAALLDAFSRYSASEHNTRAPVWPRGILNKLMEQAEFKRHHPVTGEALPYRIENNALIRSKPFLEALGYPDALPKTEVSR